MSIVGFEKESIGDLQFLGVNECAYGEKYRMCRKAKMA